MGVRPYLFYDVAVSICSTCFSSVEAKIVFQDGSVFMLKRCPEHGAERVLIADDVDYYRRCREVFIKPPEMPMRYNTPVKWGCPYDCGLCTDHEQHSCLSLVEITDSCNLRCPICYAASGPERPHFAIARTDRAHARRRRRQRGRPRRRADFRRRADDAPGFLRDARPGQGAADQASDGQHQRRPHRARSKSSPTRLAELHAGLRALPAVRLVRARRADGAARRRPAADPRAGARAAQPPQYLDHAGGDAQAGLNDRRDRQDHRLRAAAAVRARRHVAAGTGGRAARPFRSGDGPAHADRSAPQDSRTDERLPAGGRHPGAMPSGFAGDGVCAEDRRTRSFR